MFYTIVQQGFEKWQEVLYLFCMEFIAVSNNERILKVS